MMAAKIQNDAPFVGKTVKEAASVFPGIKFMPIAIQRSGSHKQQFPEEILFLKMMIMYISLYVTMEDELYNLMGTKKDKIEKIMILGGGRVGFKVAKELSNDGYSVKLVEINPDKAEHIANSLSNVLVLNIDGTR